MRSLAFFDFAGAGVSKKINKGDLSLEKDHTLDGLRCKFTATINNLDVAPNALTSAEKRALLRSISVNLKYGKRGHTPYNKVNLEQMRRLQRYLQRTDIEGWDDTATGLGKAIAADGDTEVVWYSCIPLGMFELIPELRNYFGVGRTQAKTIELEVKRNADLLPDEDENLSLAALSVEILADERLDQGDRWSYLPVFDAASKEGYDYETEDGVTLLLWETTAAHASTALEEFSLHVDDAEIHRLVRPADVITRYHDTPGQETEEDVSDEVTLLHVYANNARVRDLLSGRVKFRQSARDLTPIRVEQLRFPIIPIDDLQADLLEAAAIREKPIKAFSAELADRRGIPGRMAFVSPMILADSKDREMDVYQGLLANPNTNRVTTFYPPSLIKKGKADVGIRSESKEALGVEEVVRSIAQGIPGAVQSGRGFEKNKSGIYADVRAQLGA